MIFLTSLNGMGRTILVLKFSSTKAFVDSLSAFTLCVMFSIAVTIMLGDYCGIVDAMLLLLAS